LPSPETNGTVLKRLSKRQLRTVVDLNLAGWGLQQKTRRSSIHCRRGVAFKSDRYGDWQAVGCESEGWLGGEQGGPRTEGTTVACRAPAAHYATIVAGRVLCVQPA